VREGKKHENMGCGITLLGQEVDTFSQRLVTVRQGFEEQPLVLGWKITQFE